MEVANFDGSYVWIVRHRGREWVGQKMGVETNAMERADRLADAIRDFETRVADLGAKEKAW